MNNIIQQLADDFAAVFSGKPWYGPNYRQIISDITPEEALHVPDNGHSIARLLWHMIKWRKALAERLMGNTSYQSSDSDEDNWRDLASLDAQSWEEAKKQYDALQDVIVLELRLRNDAFLDGEFLPGKTYRWLAFGVLHHDLYHMGQIAILKNIIRSKS